MDKKRRKKLMLRWSLIISIGIATFWTMYYLINGQVPNGCALFKKMEFISLSRWWDIWIGPIFMIPMIHLITHESKDDGDDFLDKFFYKFVSLIMGLAIGIALGIILGIMFTTVFIIVLSGAYFFGTRIWPNIIQFLKPKALCIYHWIIAK